MLHQAPLTGHSHELSKRATLYQLAGLFDQRIITAMMPDGETCINDNPNVLTLDKAMSKLAQGPIAHTCLVEVEAYNAR